MKVWAIVSRLDHCPPVFPPMAGPLGDWAATIRCTSHQACIFGLYFTSWDGSAATEDPTTPPLEAPSDLGANTLRRWLQVEPRNFLS